MLRHFSIRLSSLLALLAILAFTSLAPVPAQAAPASGLTPPVGLLWDFQRPESHTYADDIGPRSLYAGLYGTMYAPFGGSHLYLYWANEINSGVETVDPAWGVGLYASLAVDPANGNYYPRVSYVDQFNNTLKYAAKSSSGWTIEKVDALGGTYGHTSLALYSSGLGTYPGISYYAWDELAHKGVLKYAYKTCLPMPCHWVTNVIDNVSNDYNGENSSLGYDSSNREVIAYSTSDHQGASSLRVAAWTGSSWTLTTLDANVTVDSIAMANKGNVFYISYARGTGVPGVTDLKVAWSTNGAAGPWSFEIVDNAAVNKAGYTSIALDSSSQPAIAYGYDLSSSSERLKLARRVGSGVSCPGNSAWKCEVAQPDPSARVYPINISLTFEADGVTPDIAYTNWAGLDASYRLVYRGGSGWATYFEPLAVPDERGYATSLALDPNGWAHISHVGTSYGLFFTEQTNATSWSTIQVTDGVSRYNSTSLALDPPTNTPYIAYIRYGALMAAHPVASSGNCGPSNTWLCETVSNASISSSGFLSLAIYNHKPYIAYHDTPNTSLKLASYVGTGGTGCIGITAWSCVTLDAHGAGHATGETDNGFYVSMAVDDAGMAIVAYGTKTSTPSYKLEAIRGTITSLAAGSVPAPETFLADIGNSSSGGWLSLAIGAHAHISYYQSLPGMIGVGHAEYVGSGGTGCAIPAWKCELLVTTSEARRVPMPRQTSIAADASGNVAISYAGSSPYFYTTLNVLRYVGSGGNAAGGRWFWQSLYGVGETGTDSSTKLDSRGLPRVSVFDATTGHLRYAVSGYGAFIPLMKK